MTRRGIRDLNADTGLGGRRGLDVASSVTEYYSTYNQASLIANIKNPRSKNHNIA